MSKCAPSFKHQQDKAFDEELKQRHLFSERNEQSSSEYTCMLDESSTVGVGDTLILMLGDAGTIIPTIMCAAVGYFDPSDQTAIHHRMSANPRNGGVALAQVSSISPLGGATIRLCE